MNCPKCDIDISDSYEPDDWSCGIVGGWYCDACDLAIGEHEVDRHHETDVGIPPIERDKPLGTPISEISTKLGEKGYAEWLRISRSWGHD